MVVPLAMCTKEELHFFVCEGIKPIEIQWKMKIQYCNACLLLQQVYKWSRKFSNNINSVVDSPQPDQTNWVVIPVTSADLLKNRLWPAIRFKWHGLLSTCVLLEHDNGQPHRARGPRVTIQDLKSEYPPHSPYSTDLAPSDFHKYDPLKEALKDKWFKSNMKV